MKKGEKKEKKKKTEIIALGEACPYTYTSTSQLLHPNRQGEL